MRPLKSGTDLNTFIRFLTTFVLFKVGSVNFIILIENIHRPTF